MIWLDRLVLELLAPLALWVLASGLDDLYLDYLWIRGLRKQRRAAQNPLPDPPESPIAILAPCWREADVIGSMLDRLIHTIDYDKYAIWVGVYPNDPECQSVIRERMENEPRIHMAVSRRPGPTTKADCLNQTLASIWEYELRTGEHYEIFMLHDAEDVVPAGELKQANRACRWYDMAQFPVFPLPTPLWEPTHGVYCDEFAESHSRDLPARAFSGGFVPSAGVGTALRRDAVDQCRIFGGRKPFDPGSLTEDYVLGLRLEAMGFSQTFVADGAATREYFPRSFYTAVRQRTRWVIGNCLQAWERFGWPEKQRYWLWRDRKGLVNHPLALVANALFLYGLYGWARAEADGAEWALGAALADEPALTGLLWLNAAFLVWRQSVRGYCVGRVYGWAQGLTVPLRAPWANCINAAATLRAVGIFLRAKAFRKPLMWAKTQHVFPEDEAYTLLEWIEPVRLDASLDSIIPADVCAGIALVAVELEGETLVVAGPDNPPAHTLRRLSMRVGREVRFQRVTWRNYGVLQEAGRPADRLKGQEMSAGRP
ncbi:MAG: glycosyltransferase [Bryobacterales bacterium]